MATLPQPPLATWLPIVKHRVERVPVRHLRALSESPPLGASSAAPTWPCLRSVPAVAPASRRGRTDLGEMPPPLRRVEARCEDLVGRAPRSTWAIRVFRRERPSYSACRLVSRCRAVDARASRATRLPLLRQRLGPEGAWHALEDTLSLRMAGAGQQRVPASERRCRPPAVPTRRDIDLTRESVR